MRRLHNPAFHQRFFVGSGLDVGSGEDGLDRYAFAFPRITYVKPWNHSDGDGTDLVGEPNDCYDFIHSSHSLEHLRDPVTALTRWLEVVKVGGHIIVTVPDHELYEHLEWPSQNGEHTHAFTMGGPEVEKPWLVSVPMLLVAFHRTALIVRIERIEATFNAMEGKHVDQTCFSHGAAESAIEFVLRRTA